MAATEVSPVNTEVSPVNTEVSPVNPHDLIKRKDVETTLKNDKGTKAVLESFNVKDFTSKGDNYACIVSSVEVKYVMDNESRETSYVVKLNPLRKGFFDKMSNVMFEKEIGAYTEIIPRINTILEKLNEPKLRAPKYYHSVDEEEKQVIYLEDLRKFGYRMNDRKKGMDKEHTELILHELARLHAASIVLIDSDEYKRVEMTEHFPILEDLFVKIIDEMGADEVFAMPLDNGVRITERIEGYQYVTEYLKTKKGSMTQDFTEIMATKEPFGVICHGDCWNNNFLFRYDSNGSPVECRLLDWQMTRVSSPAMDLNYMLYCSLDGEVRSANIDTFFTTYYASFASVMASAGQPVKFTLGQFTREFYAKNFFGLLMAIMLIPLMLVDTEDAPSFDEFQSEDIKKNMDDFHKKITELIQNNPLLAPRFLSIFDEMKESGLFTAESATMLN